VKCACESIDDPPPPETINPRVITVEGSKWAALTLDSILP